MVKRKEAPRQKFTKKPCGPGEWRYPFKQWVGGHILEAHHRSFMFGILDLNGGEILKLR